MIMMTDRRPAYWAPCVPVLMLVLTGCGSGLCHVSGKVTLDGKPLGGSSDLRVMVVFYPDGHNAAPATALTDEAGRYVVSTGAQSGLSPGDYVVTISATQIIPPAVPGSPPGGKMVSPARYADPKVSGLRVEVRDRRHTFDFALSSDPAKKSAGHSPRAGTVRSAVTANGLLVVTLVRRPSRGS